MSGSSFLIIDGSGIAAKRGATIDAVCVDEKIDLGTDFSSLMVDNIKDTCTSASLDNKTLIQNVQINLVVEDLINEDGGTSLNTIYDVNKATSINIVANENPFLYLMAGDNKKCDVVNQVKPNNDCDWLPNPDSNRFYSSIDDRQLVINKDFIPSFSWNSIQILTSHQAPNAKVAIELDSQDLLNKYEEKIEESICIYTTDGKRHDLSLTEKLIVPDSIIFKKADLLLGCSEHKSTKFRLEHKSLGEITVEMSSDLGNNLDLRVIVPNIRDIRELESQKPGIEDILRELGFNGINVEFTNDNSHNKDGERNKFQWSSYELELDFDESIFDNDSASYIGYKMSPVAILLDIMV
ncbi:hypothetical protein Cyrtocomes_00619 [Candidatus Cyrtobacter comes]|uniref:Flagellar hook-length control protein-like C-terminal domain-containing protein n=1 Tax=Candidatus Cyrtobacter comes TaxID=675776 RepID=A0ABU5L7Z4_9RICK|nr:flagellar hook-length control protein FliK [Candidatus Cyrtobacter comes]MDZ5762244.1 hypothetical protein [Candidatus Cyrtobacter comes]